jgi:hypothetical protein
LRHHRGRGCYRDGSGEMAAGRGRRGGWDQWLADLQGRKSVHGGTHAAASLVHILIIVIPPQST